MKVLETGKRQTDGKKYKKVQCIIEVKAGRTCGWVRDLVEGETGAIAKHIRTQNDAGHEAAARVCNESSCNMIQCGGGDFVSSFPFDENFAHHVITPTLCSRLLCLRPSSRCILRIATSSGGMNPMQKSRARGLWAEFQSAFWYEPSIEEIRERYKGSMGFLTCSRCVSLKLKSLNCAESRL